MKQTIVNNGKSYTREIKAKELEPILDRIYAQVSEHINDDDYYIKVDEREQLNLLLKSIADEEITMDNIEEYMQQLWEPEVLADESGSHVSVQLTVYDDGDTRFKCFLPGSLFDIYEY